MKKPFYLTLFILITLLISSFTFVDPLGLKVGEKAPQFIAKDSKGKQINLNALLKKGDVVVLFYRGFWCPYCNKQLGNLQDSLQLLSKKGASVVAITPEIDANIEKTQTKTKATFPIIHDKGGRIMAAYKTMYKVEGEMKEKYKSYGIDFEQNNGEVGNQLPVPAVYIIGKDGVIKFAYFNSDYTKRISVSDILKNL